MKLFVNDFEREGGLGAQGSELLTLRHEEGDRQREREKKKRE
jgi:hypothetical protein